MRWALYLPQTKLLVPVPKGKTASPKGRGSLFSQESVVWPSIGRSSHLILHDQGTTSPPSRSSRCRPDTLRRSTCWPHGTGRPGGQPCGAQWCSSMIKMIRGIGIPSNHRRIGIGCSFHSQVVIDVVIDATLFCPKYRPEGLRLRSLPGRPRKHR